MEMSDSELIDMMSEFAPGDIVKALQAIRADMLDRGEDPDEVAETFRRICGALGINPALMRKGMH